MERGSRMPEWLRRRPRTSGRLRGSRAAASHAADLAGREELLLSAAAADFPMAPAAHPSGFSCSCDRIGCPTPARHPVSFAWQTQASTDPEQVGRWLRAEPAANFITATGTNHDVLDVPEAAGRLALERFAREDTPVGPIALCGPDRMLFFTATRGTPEDEDEWWPCELDCHPETLDAHPGLRWHCRGSYVLLPPSRLMDGSVVSWVRPPRLPLPDPLSLLDVLTDACVQVADGQPEPEAAGGWLTGR